MLRIGEFSKLSHITVKALRFYEKQGILKPVTVDSATGYRMFDLSQLSLAATVKAYRELDLSIEEIRSILSGNSEKEVLKRKAAAMQQQRQLIDLRLSKIKSILEDGTMQYTAIQKTVPEVIVYSAETVLSGYAELTKWVPQVGEECMRLNPELKCAEPPYEFCEYLDSEYKESDISVRHNEAVTAMGQGNEHIYFRTVPETKVLSVMHKGPYETLCKAYAFLFKYAEDNGFKCAGHVRECYIDGMWNKDSSDDWLTEIQLPIK